MLAAVSPVFPHIFRRTAGEAIQAIRLLLAH
jgi:hypothetical protein